MSAIRNFFILAISAIILSNAYALEMGNPVRVQSADVNVIIVGDGAISGSIGAGDTIEIKLQTFSSNEAQEVLGISEALQIGSRAINATHETDGLGNKYAIFKIGNIESADFKYTINARIRTNSKVFDLKDYDLGAPIDEEAQFLQESTYIQSNDSGIRSLAFSTLNSNSVLENAIKAAEFAHGYITYDLDYFTTVLSAKEVLDVRKGTCDEFSNLTAALLRARGIPTRYIVGYVYSGKKWDTHAWLEFFVPGAGWIALDATYLEAGFVDGTHLVLAKLLDQSQAVDSITTTQGISVKIDRGEDVIVNDFSKFSKYTGLNVMFPGDLKGRQNFDFNLEVANLTDGKFIAPIEMRLHEQFVYESAERLVLLNPAERKTLSWNADAPDTAGLNYIYGYAIRGFDQEIEGNVSVYAAGGEVSDSANIKLVAIVPEISDGKLTIKVILKNSGMQDGIADINISGVGISGSAAEQIPSNTQKTLSYSFADWNYGAMKVDISGPGIAHLQNIEILEEKRTEKPEGTGGEGNAAGAGQGEGAGGIPAVPGNIDLVLIAAIAVLAIIAIALAILLLRKR
ncbi:MAG: transglutaminase domain-containing protein [Candidatus Diapherotrites archaeon]|nr:transglutaminase domain-containing protein [Candidatus Diapherotrites archaeon]